MTLRDIAFVVVMLVSALCFVAALTTSYSLMGVNINPLVGTLAAFIIGYGFSKIDDLLG